MNSRLRVFLLAILFFIPSCNGADMTDISRLRTTLLTNYDSLSRPVYNQGNSTDVDIYFYNSGFEFDENKAILTLHCMPVMYWRDQHMKWDPFNYGNLTEIQFRPTELWRPDVMVYNNLDKSEMDHFGNTLIVVYNTSMLYWVPPAKFQVGCVVNYLLWPYDIQQCDIVIGSWAHDGSEINLTVNKNHTEMEIDDDWSNPYENREWELISNYIKRRVSTYACCPDVPFIDIIISMTIQRRSSSHTAAVTVVALGIAAAILISFWLSPFANERVPVILISMFLNALYLNYMYTIIPYNGNVVPLAVCFFRDSLVMVTVALAWAIILRYIAKIKRNFPVPLPSFVQTFLESFVARILCLNPRPATGPGQNEVQQRSEAFDDNDELVKNENPYREDWAWLAHLLDRLAFVAYLITYASFTLTFV